MRIKMLKHMACDLGNFQPGTVVDVPQKRAECYVSANVAVYVDAPPVEKPPLDFATIKPAGVLATAKPKRKTK